MKPIRVILADDHTLVRAGIRSLLEKMPAVEVVGEAADGQEALALVAERQPDVVLMDIAMAGINGLEATGRLAREFPAVRVIILSMHGNGEYVTQARQTGARGYVLKRSATRELEAAIEAAVRGETFFSASLPHSVIAASAEPDQRSRSGQLTPRQREILRLIAESRTTKEIALLLQVSAKTVEFHRAQLMTRLNIHDVPGLVRHAMRIGLVPLESPPLG